jgi:hypothetical protein
MKRDASNVTNRSGGGGAPTLDRIRAILDESEDCMPRKYQNPKFRDPARCRRTLLFRSRDQ